MSFNIKCGEIVYSSSYKSWNNLRRSVIRSTFAYINFKLNKDLNDNDINKEEIDINYKLNKKKIYNLMESMKLGEKQNLFGTSIDMTINNFNEIVSNISYINALNYFDVGGLYFLCNKNDFEGIYSPGNAMDICNLFDLIKPFVKQNSEEVYSIVYINGGEIIDKNLYDLFKMAALENKKIYIK
jgi:hypothetical protein